MNSAKKYLAFFLALALCVSVLAGCGKNGGNESSSTPESSTTSESSQEQSSGEESQAIDVEPAEEYPAFTFEDNFDAEVAETGNGSVGHDVYAGIAGKDYTDEAEYTYNDVLSATTTMNWNALSWETADDSYVLGYISNSFYEFMLNSTKDGWSIVPEMAAELPVDVTSEYVGQFGIQEGETNKAWKIALNPDAKWEDGTAINADTYIYSYQQLLDPTQLNRRADSLYAGDFQVYGAQNYFKQGQSSFVPLGTTVQEYLDNGGSLEDLYVDPINFWGAAGYVDAEGNEVGAYVSISDETEYSADGAGDDAFSGKGLYDEYFAPGMQYESYAADYVGTVVGFEADYSWDNVGILKTGDYELVFITTKPINDPDYYVPYGLGLYLVYEPMYEELKTYTDGMFTTTYGTTAETTMSFGPYRLAYFEMDKQLTFERNENWHGYSDGKHTGQYQADRISVQVISGHETQLLAFLNGEIDGVSLQSEDMESYGSSPYIRYTPQSYTTKLTFNTDEAKLAERGTQILGNINFRHAFSLAIDRQTFASSLTAAGSAGFGMLNYQYVYDPFTGASYRNSEAAMAGLCKLYGLTYGDDGDFDDLEEAYDAITGYDVNQARELMQLAYQQCVADGSYTDGQKVQITLSVYQNDDIYVKMFNFLNDALKDACVGSGFEGNVELVMKVDADYYNTMYSGNTDMIFSTWGGAASQPFTILYECYCDASDGSGNQMEYGFDTSKTQVTMTINGKEFTNSLQNWAHWMDGDLNTIITSNDGSETLGLFTTYSSETKCQVLANLEYVYLSNYVNTPIYYRNVGSLVSQKGDYAVTEYIDTVGFGGIAFYTFNYTDEEWAAAATSLQY